MSPQTSVYFGGSRVLGGPLAQKLVGRVVRSVAQSGCAARVGCAVGADALVLTAARACGAPLSVFAVGTKGGAGFPGNSNHLAVLQVARNGASVSWLAGGPLSVPVRARLIKRSVAGLSGAGQAVFFLASPGSSGSLAVAARAAATGVPVFAFCVGFSGPPAALEGQAGQWSRLHPSSYYAQFERQHAYKPVTCYRWQAAQQKLL